MSLKWESLGNNLARYKPTGIIYVRKAFRRHKIPNLNASTGFDTIGKAKAKAQDLEAEHLNYYLHGIRPASGVRFGSGKSVSDVIEEFLKYETPTERRAGTKENHGYYYAELKRELGHHQIERITDLVWKDWMQKFRKKKRRKTFNDYAIYMNMLLRYAHGKDYVRKLVKLPFTDPKGETGRVFTQAELSALQKVMSEDTSDQLSLSYHCAMRLREVLHLMWDRVIQKRDDAWEIVLRPEDVKTGSRTGKGRSFFVGNEALEVLKRRFQNRTKGQRYVFPSKDSSTFVDSNKKAWGTAKRNAGILGKARWHDLRHTAISEMLLVHEMPIIAVSQYVGASARTLERVYLHSTAEKTRSVGLVLRISKAV